MYIYFFPNILWNKTIFTIYYLDCQTALCQSLEPSWVTTRRSKHLTYMLLLCNKRVWADKEAENERMQANNKQQQSNPDPDSVR